MSLTLLSWGGCRNLWGGPAFEPLDRNGLGALFVAFFQISECELGWLAFVLGAGRAPEPPHGARGRSGVPLAFYATLAHPFRSEGGVCLSSPSSASLGRWVSARLQEEPPSLLHGARGRSGVPLAFYTTLAHPFRSEGGICLPSPLECEPRSLGLDKVCRESPRASTRSERAVRSSPGFLCDPRSSFSLGRRGGMCQATLGGRER